jgi:3-oxoacyl-[acyl-carrier-protein] synthase-3
MNTVKVKKANLIGIVGCISNIIDNKTDLFDLFDKNPSNVIKATGIEKKSIVDNTTTALDLSIFAANRLLESSNTSVESIGVLINVSFTQENIMPGDAPKAQFRLGLNNNIMAFDLNLACSGFVYGFYLATVLANLHNTNVLLLNGDTQSKIISRLDRSTLPVMADGGSATLIGPSIHKDFWPFSFYSNGEKSNVLCIPDGGSRNPISLNSLNLYTDNDNNKRRNVDILMDGFEIYKFVAQEASKFIIDFNQINQLNDTNIDAIAFHQANIFMIKQLTKKVNLSLEKLIISGDKFGNTSSSSVPLAISNHFKNSVNLKDFNRLLMSGFGGGLSIGCGYIDFSKDSFFDLIQYNKGT